MEQIDILSDFEEEISLEPATPGQRLLNFIIDVIGCYIFLFIVAFILGVFLALGGSNLAYYSESTITIYLITLFIFTTYYTLFEGLTKGRSLGKLITRTQAVYENGSPINFKAAFIRSLCRFIPFEILSILGGRPWHDSISNTIVVKR